MTDSSLPIQISKELGEVADLFRDIGMKKNCALVLVALLQDVDLSSREIERITGLRQPEVSLAITELMKRRWIDVVRLITENKGRPVKIYHIIKKPEDILEELREEVVDDYERRIQEIEHIKEIILKKN